MSKSQRWKIEWSFFLDVDGRRKYHELCRRCVHRCKQSFRVKEVLCPYYLSKRTDRALQCRDKG